MRVTPEEKNMITQYAQAHGKSISAIMRDSFFERLEDEMDIRDYKQYLKDKAADKVKFYTHDEILKEYGLEA
jgi:uncharacterized protein (DUF1778 family)